MAEDLRERIARALYKQGAYCGNCSFEGWDSCAECRQTLLSYAVAVLDVLADADPRSIEQSPWEAYQALIESIMKNADHDFWDSGSDIEAVAYVRHLEDEVERLRRVCADEHTRMWVGEFDEEDDRD